MTSIDELKFDERGLIPAIIQDARTGQVLTLAWMNRESLGISMEKELTCSGLETAALSLGLGLWELQSFIAPV